MGDEAPIERILTIDIPMSEDLKAEEYVSRNVEGRTIYLSEIGICIMDTSPNMGDLDAIAEAPQIVINPDSEKIDLREMWSMSFVSDMESGRYMNIKLNKIIETDKVDSLEINGIIYKKKK